MQLNGSYPRRSLYGLHNTMGFVSLLRETLVAFDKMFAKRAFVHWFVGEGIEDESFSIGRHRAEEIV